MRALRKEMNRIIKGRIGVIALVGIIVFSVMLAGCAPEVKTVSEGDGPVTKQTAATVTVSGESRMEVTPDMAEVNLGVETALCDSAEEASQKSAQIIDEVIQAVMEQGVKEEDVKTSDYFLWPQQQYDNKGNYTGTKFTSSVTLTVTVREVENTAKVIDAAVDAGANTSYGISFGLQDPTSRKAEQLALAVEDAKKKAEAMAKAMGMSLGGVVSLTDGTTIDESPATYYESTDAMASEAPEAEAGADMAGSSHIKPGTMEIHGYVSARFFLE